MQLIGASPRTFWGDVRFRALCVPILLGLVATLAGCRASETNTVIARTQSPDAKLTALLVNNATDAALQSDVVSLLVIRSDEDVSKAINSENSDSTVLVATNAQKVRVQWKDQETLAVICKACGLEAIDIIKNLDRINSVKIIYLGFPKGASYDL